MQLVSEIPEDIFLELHKYSEKVNKRLFWRVYTLGNGPVVKFEKRKDWSKCTPEEERFCDLVLKGVQYSEAVYESGIMDRDVPNKKAASKGYNLSNTKRCTEYMRAHSKKAVIYTPNDFDVLATHMYEIGMGRATRTYKKKNSDGEVEEIEETPSFRDQTAAATWVLAYMKFTAQKVVGKQTDLNSDEIIDAKAKAFLSKWKTRDIEGPHERGVSGKRRSNLLENIGDDVDDADYEEALDADQSEYRI